jgi:hypothetical protein
MSQNLNYSVHTKCNTTYTHIKTHTKPIRTDEGPREGKPSDEQPYRTDLGTYPGLAEQTLRKLYPHVQEGHGRRGREKGGWNTGAAGWTELKWAGVVEIQPPQRKHIRIAWTDHHHHSYHIGRQQAGRGRSMYQD